MIRNTGILGRTCISSDKVWGGMPTNCFSGAPQQGVCMIRVCVYLIYK